MAIRSAHPWTPSPTRRLLALLVPLAALLALLPGGARLAAADEPPETDRYVRLVIDYGDGAERHFTQLEGRPEMTVLELLEAAQRHPRGIRFGYRGSGPRAFLTQIDDLENEGGRGRNWIYHVNDQSGDRSFAVRPVEPGDVVLWEFTLPR